MSKSDNIFDNFNTERLKNFLESDTPKAKIATVALCVLALASLPVLVMGASAIGNAVQCFKMYNGSKKFSKKQISSAIDGLKRQGLIEYTKKNDSGVIFRLTGLGENKLKEFDIEQIKIKNSNKWDGKWRMVMFDIPMRFTKGREALRYHLKNLDFFQFQKSVWIYPFKCEEEVAFICDFFGVSDYVEIMTVEKIKKDKRLKKYFRLL